jgi:hypothetical protein
MRIMHMLASKQRDVASVHRSFQKDINEFLQAKGNYGLMLIELKVLRRRVEATVEELRELEYYFRTLCDKN